MLSRLVRGLLGLLFVTLLLVTLGLLRLTVFAPRFNVVSIATTQAYQDPALLARAWALPVAATFQKRLDFQPNASLCGPASLGNVLRSLSLQPTDVHGVLQGAGKCAFDFCFGGLTLDELAVIARAKSGRSVTVLRDLSLPQFRAALLHANELDRRYTVNFNRGLLFGEGHGHHSPIAGYLAAEDLVFVLDVNAKFKPWLVSSARLYRAMDTVDSGSGRKRGLLLIQ